MGYFLYLLAIAAFGLAGLVMTKAETPIHELEAIACVALGVLCLGIGYFICDRERKNRAEKKSAVRSPRSAVASRRDTRGAQGKEAGYNPWRDQAENEDVDIDAYVK